MTCLFCKIIDRDLNSHIIYEDDLALAFDDMNPQAPHHKLIVPKKHIATINDLKEEDSYLIGHLILVGKQLAEKLSISENGYRLVLNCNASGGQAVYHIHLHLIGGRQMHWPPG
jgi:histidine triad (HIT) family protein